MFKHLFFLITSQSLFALTTLQVSLSTDNKSGEMGETGDLRYCLNLMNESLNTTPDDEYKIVFVTPMTIQLNGILPIINNSSSSANITIGNAGSIPTVTIDGNGLYSGFFIPMGNVIIQNMIFQNLAARGGNGGDGISGGGGGMGAGGAIYAPQSFLNGSQPSITLMNVLINDCSAIGGSGGSYLGSSFTGNEGGGGGGGFSGNGGSIMIIGTPGSTGGGGGGGFGGDGGNVLFSIDDSQGGGGGGGGGIGSRAIPILGTLTNLATGGSDQEDGLDGNAYGLLITAGSGAGGHLGGDRAGGGGGGGGLSSLGGGGGGSSGSDGIQPQGSTPPGGSTIPSGGNGGDGAGGGGGGIVITSSNNDVDGQAGSGGYGGGGGGGAGTGAYDMAYTVQGGAGGFGGGGGGGGVNQSGNTPSDGGNSLGGGGGGGGGPSNGSNAPGGLDEGNLGGGAGGVGADTVGSTFGGGGGGGGSGLGGAIFVDSNLNFTIQALQGIPTTFNTSNNTTIVGNGGLGAPGGSNGADGSALGNSIFLRIGSSLTLMANNANDLLTLGEQVAFTNDTAGGTNVFVTGNGTVIYNGITDYQGSIIVNNANFKVNGLIDGAPISICRNIGFSSQRGTLSGTGTLTGNVSVNSGIISPDAGETLTLGSLELSPADLVNGTLGSLVHIEIDSSSTSLVNVTGSATLAGTLEFNINPNAQPGTYIVLTSSGIIGTFDFVTFTGATPNYSLSYLPTGNPTFVQLDFFGFPSNLEPPSNLQGKQKKNDFGLEYEFYNQLIWTPSPSAGVSGYYIYRDGEKIATVDAATHAYQDHNRKKGVSYIYAITAFNSDGSESSPISIVITP